MVALWTGLKQVCVRDYLLRVMLREKEPDNREMPWYPWDNALVEYKDLSEEEFSRDLTAEETEVEQFDRGLEEQREVTESVRIIEQQQNVITLSRGDVISTHAGCISDYKLAYSHAVGDYSCNERVIKRDGRYAAVEHKGDAGSNSFDFLNTTATATSIGPRFSRACGRARWMGILF